LGETVRLPESGVGWNGCPASHCIRAPAMTASNAAAGRRLCVSLPTQLDERPMPSSFAEPMRKTGHHYCSYGNHLGMFGPAGGMATDAE
jgi:hypothetical protein